MKLARGGAWLGPQNLEMVFRRVDNAFIHRLELTFEPANRALFRSLSANTDELQCHVGTFYPFLAHVQIDYVLVDFLCNLLKPQTYETEMAVERREDYAMLFTRAALRGSIKHLEYKVSQHPKSE